MTRSGSRWAAILRQPRRRESSASQAVGRYASSAFLIRLAGAFAAVLLTGVILLISGRNSFSLAGDALSAAIPGKIGFEDTLLIATPHPHGCGGRCNRFPRSRVEHRGRGAVPDGSMGSNGRRAPLRGPFDNCPSAHGYRRSDLRRLVGAGPAWAKAKLDINEIVTTLLLNFVAVQWVIWWSTDMWLDRDLGVLAASRRISAEFPKVPGTIILNWGFAVPVLLAILFAYIFRKSIWGYEVDLTGGNRAAAEYAGIPVANRIITVLVVSGAIAGLSGMIQLTGSFQRLIGTLENNYGVSGFIVAALAGASFLAVLVVGGFVAFPAPLGNCLVHPARWHHRQRRLSHVRVHLVLGRRRRSGGTLQACCAPR